MDIDNENAMTNNDCNDYTELLGKELDWAVSEELEKIKEKYKTSLKTAETDKPKGKFGAGRKAKSKKGLTFPEIILLKEIMALTGNGSGKSQITDSAKVPVCIKTKQAFAEQYCTTPQNINTYLRKLESYGFIKRTKRSHDGKIYANHGLIQLYLCDGDIGNLANPSPFEIKISNRDFCLLEIDEDRLKRAKEQFDLLKKQRLEKKKRELEKNIAKDETKQEHKNTTK